MKRLQFTKAKKVFLFLAIISAGISSCKKDMLTATSGTTLNTLDAGIPGYRTGKVFDVSRFRTNIQNTLLSPAATTQPRGFTFVISKDGKPVDSLSFGTAYVTNNSSGKQHVNQEINIASVTKTMTAVAVLQLIKKHNLNIGSKIGIWLPDTWNPSSAIRNLTFQELLTHSSGITQMNTAWSDVRNTIKGPLDSAAKPEDLYANMNFAKFRVIIPYMQDSTTCINREKTATGFEAWLSDRYLAYMQQKVFTPTGLGSITCKPSVNTATMFSEPPKNTFGSAVQTLDDWTQLCGGGIYMSAMEMARFMAYLSHTNILLDQTQRNLMDSKYLGWDKGDSDMTIIGRSYGKGGALWTDSNNSTVQDNGDAGLQTIVVKFPNKIELSVIINSIPAVIEICQAL